MAALNDEGTLLSNSFLNSFICFHVNGRCGLIKKQNFAVTHQRTGQTQELPLANTEIGPAFGDNRVELFAGRIRSELPAAQTTRVSLARKSEAFNAHHRAYLTNVCSSTASKAVHISESLNSLKGSRLNCKRMYEYMSISKKLTRVVHLNTARE